MTCSKGHTGHQCNSSHCVSLAMSASSEFLINTERQVLAVSSPSNMSSGRFGQVLSFSSILSPYKSRLCRTYV
jgi:hypothetical protein